MKKVSTKNALKKTTKSRDMSIFELSKVMMKEFKSVDIKRDELAGMVARGFTEVNENINNRFDGLEGRVDGVEGRLESVEGRLNILDHKVDRVQDSVNEISYGSRKKTTRIENLELKVFGSIQEA